MKTIYLLTACLLVAPLSFAADLSAPVPVAKPTTILDDPVINPFTGKPDSKPPEKKDPRTAEAERIVKRPPMPGPPPMPAFTQPAVPQPHMSDSNQNATRQSVWKIIGRSGNFSVVTDNLSSSGSTPSLVQLVPNGGLWDNCVVSYPTLDCTPSVVKKAKEARDKQDAVEVAKRAVDHNEKEKLVKTANELRVQLSQPPSWWVGTSREYFETSLGGVDVVSLKNDTMGVRVPKANGDRVATVINKYVLARENREDYVYFMTRGMVIQQQEGEKAREK